MPKLSKSVDEYRKAGGWSSSLFFVPALALMKKLEQRNVKVKVGRTVIYLDDDLKVYVHHNGRSKEYATVTDMEGKELFTAHYTEFEKLEVFIEDYLFAQ